MLEIGQTSETRNFFCAHCQLRSFFLVTQYCWHGIKRILRNHSMYVQTPLGSSSVDVAVFCLSLMGTNFPSYLNEAHRILKPRSVHHILLKFWFSCLTDIVVQLTGCFPKWLAFDSRSEKQIWFQYWRSRPEEVHKSCLWFRIYLCDKGIFMFLFPWIRS